MRLSPTLSAYFGRQFTLWVLGTFAAIMAIVFLLDLIELMRRGSGKEGAYFAILIEMALPKLPSMGQQIMPFAVLFGSMLASRSEEHKSALQPLMRTSSSALCLKHN